MSLPTVMWIAVNELRRLAADRTLVFFALLLPVVIIVIIGTTFGTAGTIDIGVFDADGSSSSRAVVERLEAMDDVDLERYETLEALRRDVRTAAVHAAVVVPAGYEGALDGGSATVEIEGALRSNGFGPAFAAVEGAVAAEGVRAAAVALVEQQGASADDARSSVDEVAESLARVPVQELGDDDDVVAFGSFDYTAPSNLVLFVFINTFAVSALLATDRKRGIVQRLLVTPHRTGTIVAGIGAAKLLFALLQSSLIIGIGASVFGVTWGDPVGAAALTVLFAVLATGFGLTVGAVVSDANQAQSVGIPLAVAMGMLGGCMWPLDVVPDVMRVLGHAVPHAWAMDAWMQLVFDGADVVDILPELAVLSGFAVVLGATATRCLRRAVTAPA